LVGIEGTEFQAYTDSAGRFRVDGVPRGSQSLVFRHLAYGEHTHGVVIEESSTLVELQVRLSREAIELSPLVVDVLSELEQRHRASGFSIHEIRFEEIQTAVRNGLTLFELLRHRMAGIKYRRISGSRDCLEYRFMSAGTTCREMTVVIDGVPVSEPGLVLPTMDLDEIERLEVLSPGQAGARYGSLSGYGVLLVETRTGLAPGRTGRSATMSPFDWAQEAEPYPWSRVLATSFVGNAIGLGLAYLPVAYCSHAWTGSLTRRARCHPWVATGVGFAAIGLPGLAGGASATWAGTTERSQGHRGRSMSLGTLSNGAGALLLFTARSQGSDARQVAGLAVLALGTPLVVTLSDRFFRRLR
jgi:hypothetical protein